MPHLRLALYAVALLFAVYIVGELRSARAQEPASDGGAQAAPRVGTTGDVAPKAPPKPALPALLEEVSLIELTIKGGPIMVPIGLLSILAAAMAIERAIALRRVKVMPQGLVDELGQLASAPGGFDPRKAYRICQKFPSAAAKVIQAMLLKVGRPHSEVEHAVSQASDREAERLYSNVTWLNLCTNAAPLLGLLGTVWGLIEAFFQSTKLAPGTNKAELLSEGIYVALVTTVGGLVVAIPAAVAAHFLEGRIQKLFHEIDEFLFNLLPQIERFEGRLRFGRSPGEADNEGSKVPLDVQIAQEAARAVVAK